MIKLNRLSRVHDEKTLKIYRWSEFPSFKRRLYYTNPTANFHEIVWLKPARIYHIYVQRISKNNNRQYDPWIQNVKSLNQI